MSIMITKGFILPNGEEIDLSDSKKTGIFGISPHSEYGYRYIQEVKTSNKYVWEKWIEFCDSWNFSCENPSVHCDFLVKELKWIKVGNSSRKKITIAVTEKEKIYNIGNRMKIVEEYEKEDYLIDYIII